jgi:hypothetical protein
MTRGKAQRQLLPRLLAVTTAVIALVAASVAHMACARGERPTLGHDAYIWQRQWTPSLDRAVIASASRVRAWRALAAEVDSGGHIAESSPHFDVLAGSDRPVIAVVRVSSGRDLKDYADLIRLTRTLVRRWRDAGVNVTGVEMDHDCPTGSLPRYASFLAALRRAHPRDVTLSITALPTWLDSARLRDVLQHVDEAVLQVHAVQHPRAGLFDRGQARAWVHEWAEVSAAIGAHGVPFRVALPTYGSRVTWTEAGRITAIESEARTFADPASGRELFVTPLEMTAFLDTLRGDSPSNLTGLVWFRVPTAEDERAWSLETWHAVMDGRARAGINATGINATVEPSATIPGLYDVYLRNRGNVDAMIPERVTLMSQGTCEAADAVAPYEMQKRVASIEFRRVTPRLLARERQTLIGWVRCPIEEIQVDVGS